MKSLRSKWLCAFLLAIAVASLGYGWLAYDYWSNPPRLTRNYTAELNAPILNVPEAQRAWLIYREVLIELAEQQPQPAVDEYLVDESDVLSNPLLATWVRQCEPSLAKARKAAQLPSLGYVLSCALSPEDLQLALRFTAAGERAARTNYLMQAMTENPPLIHTHIQPIVEINALWKCLSADALLAARDGDGRRATDDLFALLGIAEHLRQIPLFLGEFAAWQRSTRALKFWGRLLEQHPSAFSDEQLQELETAVRSRSIGDLQSAFAAERLMFLDFVQRIYTDDGEGEGRYISTVGLNLLPLDTPPTWEVRLFAPIRARLSPSRRETIAEYDALQSLAAIEAARPYWECDGWKSEEQFRQLRVERRDLLVVNFGTQGERLNRLQQGFIQARDAMLTASALVRFRRKQGAWPKTLAELVPDYMPEMPLDRFTGKSLGYVPNESQPVLYAVGPDGRDDGGKPARIITTQRQYTGAELDRKEIPWYWDFGSGVPGIPQDGDLILWPVAPPETKAKAPADELD